MTELQLENKVLEFPKMILKNFLHLCKQFYCQEFLTNRFRLDFSKFPNFG